MGSGDPLQEKEREGNGRTIEKEFRSGEFIMEEVLREELDHRSDSIQE